MFSPIPLPVARSFRRRQKMHPIPLHFSQPRRPPWRSLTIPD
jgi:hypothetical protein